MKAGVAIQTKDNYMDKFLFIDYDEEQKVGELKWEHQ